MAVQTIDNAVTSHRHFVVSLLAELGSSATFVLTYRWTEGQESFKAWEEIKDTAEIGFEIGNRP